MVSPILWPYFSQPAHRDTGLEDYQAWILDLITEISESYMAEFRALWAAERTGILYPKSVFEDQGHSADAARDALLARIWSEAMGFCGIEMHRRTLSLAHNADFESIEDTSIRAPLEARNLMMGRELILRRAEITDHNALNDLARSYNAKDIL